MVTETIAKKLAEASKSVLFSSSITDKIFISMLNLQRINQMPPPLAASFFRTHTHSTIYPHTLNLIKGKLLVHENDELRGRLGETGNQYFMAPKVRAFRNTCRRRKGRGSQVKRSVNAIINEDILELLSLKMIVCMVAFKIM